MDEQEVRARAQAIHNAFRAVWQRYEEVIGSKGFDLYEPEESDVIVDTYSKSGTTLTQQLVHQLLRERGATLRVRVHYHIALFRLV